MKALIKPIILIVLSSYYVQAQNNEFGIFNTWQDYNSNKLSIVCHCDSSGDKIKLHHLFSGHYIDLIKNGVKTRLSKDSIFGFRDCNQNNFRFYKEYDKEYKLMENKSIVIYSMPGTVYSYNGKIRQLTYDYFFSTSLNSAILPLTIPNLKKAFPDNIRFHDLLDVYINSQPSVYAFDNEHGLFKINYLLMKSANN